MDIKPLRGFEDYLRIEEENLFKSIALLDKDYQYITELDNLYESCLHIPLPEDENLTIPAFLYLISLEEFYCGTASFLRFHKTKAFRCLRAALDSSFTAYYLLKNPDATNVYVNKMNDAYAWEQLFRNIKITIKNRPRDFPLASGLPEVYDLCSKFAHADPEGILHKYFMDKKEQRLYAQFFDYEKTAEDYKKWFGFLIFHFFKIFLIFWNEMLKTNAGSRKRHIEKLVKDFRTRIYGFRKRFPVE